MTNDPIRFRLRLSDVFFCPFTHTVRPEKREQVTTIYKTLLTLPVAVTKEHPESRMIEIETHEPAGVIENAVGTVYSVYQIPPQQDLPNVAPNDFMP